MKTLLHNKVKFLIMVLFAASLTAFAGPGAKNNSAKKEYRSEYKSLKGVCNCYKVSHNKLKPNKQSSAKYREYQIRNHRP